MARGRIRMLVAVVASALLSTVCFAATPVLISPTVVEIKPARRSASIEVTNVSDDTVDLQMRGFDWSQADGQDRLTPSSALVLSPAIATIPPRGKQLFRVLQVGPTPPGERAFRVRINELPKPGKAKEVTVNLEFLVPVFRVADDAAPVLRWRRTSDGLTLENGGGRRVRVTDATMIAADGRRLPIPAAQSAYILAGSRRSFTTPAFPIDRIAVSTDLGPIDVVRADAVR